MRRLSKGAIQMADIILKCRYLSPRAKSHAGNLIRYIATREGVEIIDKRENYVGYIAMRPGAEKRGAHGLFSAGEEKIFLSKVAREVAAHEGIVWTNILSITRKDAGRLGYDRAEAWRTLLKANTHLMADAMKIPVGDLIWYAAFHNEAHHPHIHMVAYSKGKEPYLSEAGIQKMKSAFAREIFREDLLPIYAMQTERREAIGKETEKMISEILSAPAKNPVLIAKFTELSTRLKMLKGRKVYGYLPGPLRKLTDEILTELSKEDALAACYAAWQEGQHSIESIYQDAPRRAQSLSENKAFRNLKNKIITEALSFAMQELTFEELPETDEGFCPETEEEPMPKRPKQAAAGNLSQLFAWYFEAKECLSDDPENERYDPKKGEQLLRLSVAGGLEVAKYRLGMELLTGKHFAKDAEEGLELLWECAKQGNQYAQYQLGRVYLAGVDAARDITLAESLFKSAADQGNSFAMYSLAKMHFAGLAKEASVEQAIELLADSAEKDNVHAEYLLGKFYLRGEHVPKDSNRAETLLKKAAKKDHAQAEYLLGKTYAIGQDLPKDMTKALRYLRRACKKENQYAQYQLGKMYLFGQGIMRDEDAGKAYLSKAAAQGNPYAKLILETYRPHRPSVPAGIHIMRLAGYFTEIFPPGNLRIQKLTEQKLRAEITERKRARGLRTARGQQFTEEP